MTSPFFPLTIFMKPLSCNAMMYFLTISWRADMFFWTLYRDIDLGASFHLWI